MFADRSFSVAQRAARRASRVSSQERRARKKSKIKSNDLTQIITNKSHTIVLREMNVLFNLCEETRFLVFYMICAFQLRSMDGDASSAG